MTDRVPPVVGPEWLLQHLGDPDLQVIDATWHLAVQGRDAMAEFQAARIPGAVHFDIDTVSARTPAPPNRMLPSAEIFAEEVGHLGLCPDAHLVVYDAPGLYSAARVWWMFRTFGHARISVLDGGLPAWRRIGGKLETGPAAVRTPVPWPVREAADTVRDWRQVLDNIRHGNEQLVDVRPAASFHGSTAAQYPGVRDGHIPGAINLSQRYLLYPDTTLRSPAEIRTILSRGGIDPAKPIVATCGSGVTACILALALELAGLPPCAIYDGSWEEWGGRADLPAAMTDSPDRGVFQLPE